MEFIGGQKRLNASEALKIERNWEVAEEALI
jgi:hypothetical protein